MDLSHITTWRDSLNGNLPHWPTQIERIWITVIGLSILAVFLLMGLAKDAE